MQEIIFSNNFQGPKNTKSSIIMVADMQSSGLKYKVL